MALRRYRRKARTAANHARSRSRRPLGLHRAAPPASTRTPRPRRSDAAASSTFTAGAIVHSRDLWRGATTTSARVSRSPPRSDGGRRATRSTGPSSSSAHSFFGDADFFGDDGDFRSGGGGELRRRRRHARARRRRARDGDDDVARFCIAVDGRVAATFDLLCVMTISAARRPTPPGGALGAARSALDGGGGDGGGASGGARARLCGFGAAGSKGGADEALRAARAEVLDEVVLVRSRRRCSRGLFGSPPRRRRRHASRRRRRRHVLPFVKAQSELASIGGGDELPPFRTKQSSMRRRHLPFTSATVSPPTLSSSPPAPRAPPRRRRRATGGGHCMCKRRCLQRPRADTGRSEMRAR